MSERDPAVQAAYDELTAAIEKIAAVLGTSPEHREMVAEYAVIYRYDAVRNDTGSHVSGNGMIVRNGYVPLSHVAGLSKYMQLSMERKFATTMFGDGQ